MVSSIELAKLELEQHARNHQFAQMPEGLSDDEQIAWLEEQIRLNRDRMGLSPTGDQP